jgi:cytidine deaminase
MYRKLMESAVGARKNAYAPYSGYRVGAALLAEDGRIFTGCNVENAAYSPTLCAERVAVGKAVSEGATRFTAIAVVGGAGKRPSDTCTPCGVCRQVLVEFASPEFAIVVGSPDRYTVYTLADLLPFSFGAGELE